MSLPNMIENWEEIINQLEAVQRTYPPGDPRIFDVAGVIQDIQADALGGNFGHAQYFLQFPEEKRDHLAAIEELVYKFLPPA